MSNHREDIFALSSGSPPSAISIIRISGSNLNQKTNLFLKNKLFHFKPREFFLSQFFDPQTNESIDDIGVIFFKTPHSYTGEDLLELHCHGSSFVVNKIFKVLKDHNMRLAEAGEFSKRAFLNGKLDLTKVEGIKALIDSVSEGEWFAARKLMSGDLSSKIKFLRGHIIRSLAFVEARIDFPDEEDTKALPLDPVRHELKIVCEHLEKLIATYHDGQITAQGLKVSIIGEPNSGKSTLLNTFLGKNRAIVSNTPGTTRDYIEEKFLLDGRLIKLIDTAGIRETSNDIEKEGIRRSLELARESDFVLVLQAFDNEILPPEIQNFILNNKEKSLLVYTKNDLNHSVKAHSFEFVSISCHKNMGLNLLKEKLISRLDLSRNSLGSEAFLTNFRQLQSCENCLSFLKEILAKLYNTKDQDIEDELLAFDLKEASGELAQVIGEIYADDLLDVVFQEFCIGK